MRVLGLKLTHDAGVALVEDGRLVFSIEMEKVADRSRYTRMEDLKWIDEVLDREGVTWESIDKVSVDGWKHYRQRHLVTADYETGDMQEGEGQISERHRGRYVSFPHAINHVTGSYAMSPFSRKGEEVTVVVWDGGMPARLYSTDGSGTVRTLERLPIQSVSLYGDMGLFWGPFKGADRPFGKYEWPGKIMAWIAGGEVVWKLYHRLAEVSKEGIIGIPMMQQLMREFPDLDDRDVLMTIHTWLGKSLVNELERRVPRGDKLIFTGGAALNIKWNSWLRTAYDVWVPPVPNDSGSALGAAVSAAGTTHLDWDVFSGPHLIRDDCPGWRRQHADCWDLAHYLAANDETPVLVLQGRAEIGPRALGHRSIVMSARSPNGKDILNRIKGREEFRPVAPICLERESETVFRPGGHDPYMLFDHSVREGWTERVPAIVHLDGTARLQTVSSGFMHETLLVYRDLTGIPLLCNTSANKPGSGFFDRLSSATRWCESVGIDRVYVDEAVYVREK